MELDLVDRSWGLMSFWAVTHPQGPWEEQSRGKRKRRRLGRVDDADAWPE